jgi:hypothetical protein
MYFIPDYPVTARVVLFLFDHIGDDLSPIIFSKVRQLVKIILVPKPSDGFGTGSEVPPYRVPAHGAQVADPESGGNCSLRGGIHPYAGQNEAVWPDFVFLRGVGHPRDKRVV